MSLDSLAQHVRQRQDTDPPSEVDAGSARERFIRAARLPRSASRARPVAIGAAAVLVAAAAGVWLWIGHRGSFAPSYEIAGGRGQIGVELAPTTATPIRFSDGSKVDLDSNARMRVASLDARGAHLVLESGRARFDLAGADADRWTVQAGDFEVHGVGASKFELSFLVPAEEIDLAVHDGHVELLGSCVEKRSVAAPAHVHVTCAKETTHAEPTRSTTAPSDLRVVEVVPKPLVIARPSWRALAAQSRWSEALAEAIAGDFDHECDTGSAADLLSLGDVARLAHDAPHARHAYDSLRARFPGDPSASVASFSLGKLAFDEDHAYGEAGRAFDAYLREQPHGALARDALARSMEAHLRAGDRDTARSLAQRYLDEYPGGPQQDVARGIVAK